MSEIKKLGLVVFCKGEPSILEAQLEALKKQSLSPKLWEPVFIFRVQEASFPEERQKKNRDKSSLLEKAFLENKKQIQKFFPFAKILALPSSQKVYEMRNLAFNKIQSPIIYFLDEDVILDKSDHLEAALKLHSLNSSLTAIGGVYLDHPQSSFFGKIYNWIVRLWVKKHQSGGRRDFLPAGNFSIKNNKKFSARFYSSNPSGFGSEELVFFKSLHKEGFLSAWMTQLDTKHLAQHSFKDFLKRAWLQGRSLAPKDWFAGKNLQVFVKEPAPLLYKFLALVYLFLVRISAIWKSVFLKKRKRI